METSGHGFMYFWLHRHGIHNLAHSNQLGEWRSRASSTKLLRQEAKGPGLLEYHTAARQLGLQRGACRLSSTRTYRRDSRAFEYCIACVEFLRFP